MDLKLAPPPVPKSTTDNSEIIYSLPKTYNGKTVFDLFPEFKQDSVLRFSKLFGLGRVTSLPKIWKGSQRKRKKQKTNSTSLAPNSENTNIALNNSQSISEENVSITKPNNDIPINMDDDIFKMLDDAFVPVTEETKDINNENKMTTEEVKEDLSDKNDLTKKTDLTKSNKIETTVEEVLEFIVDDEIDFMKAFRILEEADDKNHNTEIVELEKNEKSDSTWRYGPANYWYEMSDPSIYIIKEKTIDTKNQSKIAEKKKKKFGENNSDYEMNDANDPKSPKTESKSPKIEDYSTKNDTIDLKQAVHKLNEHVQDEKYLLVSTMNWEDNILIDMTSARNGLTNDDTSSNIPRMKLLPDQSDEIINERIKYAGWIPSGDHRTLYSYQSKMLGKKVDFLEAYKEQSGPTLISGSASSKEKAAIASTVAPIIWNSIFPNENYDLFHGDWEKKIILDPENIDPCLYNPPEFVVDPNDDNLLLGIPDDPSSNTVEDAASTGCLTTVAKGKDLESADSKKDKNKIYENRTKISKSLLGRTGVIKDDQNADIDSDSAVINPKTGSNEPSKNFWNISNDEYYNPKVISDQTTVSKNVTLSLVLQHTIVAIELRQTFFPTYLNPYKCRNFHRYPIKRYLSGVLTNELSFYPINSFLKKVYHMGKKLEKPILMTVFPTTSSSTSVSATPNDSNAIQLVSDLTCTDNCEIILAEYSEQFPPLMMQVGMATKIRNLYKRKFAKDDGPQNLDYGESVYVNNSPFLGSLKPGDFLQSIENYMFRAPIYKHKMPEQDFLLIRNRHTGYTIRGDFKTLFVVGQECPLIEVPGPNSKRANSFLKDYLQAHIFRLFHKSRDIPRRIKLEDIKKLFPTQPENGIKKRLKLCADLQKSDLNANSNWWILKEEIRLPTEEEIRSMMTPEQCCAYYSMCAAEQRLKDAGYGEKNLFASDDDDVDNIKIDDEVKNAPWHTTRAYIDAIKGKCLLQINGVADPTGRGEGFSYVRQAFKQPNKQEEEQEKAEKAEKKAAADELAAASPQPTTAAKRTVTGTDADLRRLHLSQAKELLASYGVPDHEIKKLKRWEIIDVVRTMSTQKSKEGNGSAVSKFARGNRNTQSDAHEKFREECQNIFDMQNRNLASEDFLSTDDDEDLDEDSDVDEMGKNLESMLQNKMISTETTDNQKATTESKASNKPIDKSTELKNLIMSKTTDSSNDPKNAKTTSQEVPPNMHRILRITRTYRDEDTGQELTKVEIIKKPLIIDAYVKIRSTKDDEFIRTAFALDETEKEKLRKERRRLQEQLRRVKRNEAKRANNDDNSPIDSAPPKVRKYNKSGLPRKKKITAKMLAAGQGGEGGDTPMALGKKKKSMLNIDSSADDDKSMSFATGGDMHGDQSQSNLLDTTASSLNNTLSSANPTGVVKKRKYIKRKKNDAENSSTPAELGLSKVEGTKLIIQKKAIKLALNDEFGSTTPDVKIKKPRISKKMLKSQLSSMMVESNPENPGNNDPNQSGDNLQVPKLKIINKNKQLNSGKKSSSGLILHIPKEKLGSSFNNNNNNNSQLEPGEMSFDNTMSMENSPSKKMNSNQPKRTYNKTNSLLKKQQKMMMHQQQQLEQQLKMQMSQAQFSAGADGNNADQNQFAAAFAGILEMQQMFAMQQQMGMAPSGNNVPMHHNTHGNRDGLDHPSQPGTSSSKKFTQQQPQNAHPEQQLKRKQSSQQMDYLIKPHLKKADRRHADPLVSYASILENILNELRESPDAQPFILPVNSKKVPDYYNLVKNPIDLQTIRKRINEKVYKNRSQFLGDIQLLVENSSLYNGSNHTITSCAENLLFMCEGKLDEKKDKLLRLEKAINPLLDGDSLIAINYLLNQIFEQKIMGVENSFAFLKPVNKGKYKDYYEVIKSPIDLEAIKSKINGKKYKSRDEFISDFELLYNNSLTYNGLNNSYTNTAQKLLSVCKRSCNIEYNEQLSQFEEMAGQDHHDDENSQSSYVTPGRIKSSFSIDTNTDNESNLAPNDSYIEPGYKETDRSSNNNLPIPILSLSKKLKSLNKRISTNQKSRNLNSSTPSGSKNNVNLPSTSASANKKSSQFFFPKMHKDSPKSGSDADVFVDVESIDDRGSGYGLIEQSKNKHDHDNEDIYDQGEYESGDNVYNEDF